MVRIVVSLEMTLDHVFVNICINGILTMLAI